MSPADDETVAVYLDREEARSILEQRGWHQRRRGGWESPAGAHYWHIEEALGVVLAGIAAAR